MLSLLASFPGHYMVWECSYEFLDFSYTWHVTWHNYFLDQSVLNYGSGSHEA